MPALAKQKYDYINLAHFMYVMRISISKRLAAYVTGGDVDGKPTPEWVCRRVVEITELYFVCVEVQQCARHNYYWRWIYVKDCPY